MMYSSFLVVIGSVFLLTTLITLSSPKKRAQIFGRLYDRRGRTIISLTPPRSLSPKRQGLPPNEVSNYRDVFPPSRRQALAQCHLNGPGASGSELSNIVQSLEALPDKIDTSTVDPKRFTTATGFTVEDINRLGDFPDYAALSGVPLPETYKNFDITKAQPRPFRPLRWAYHQTMCKVGTLCLCIC